MLTPSRCGRKRKLMFQLTAAQLRYQPLPELQLQDFKGSREDAINRQAATKTKAIKALSQYDVVELTQYLIQGHRPFRREPRSRFHESLADRRAVKLGPNSWIEAVL